MGGETAEEGRASPLLRLDLHNFEESGSRYLLTSPRSLEACARQGVRPLQLLRKSLRQFLSEHPGASQLGALRLYEEAETRRQRNLHRCQQERQKLLWEDEAEEEEALTSPTTPTPLVPDASARSLFTAEDPDYEKEIQRSEEWLRGPSSFTDWGEMPAGGGGRRRLETAARKSWSSGDVDPRGSADARKKVLLLVRDIEREAGVSLPARDRKIAALMLARHQEERDRQERGFRAAWEEQKAKSAERSGGRRTGPPPEKRKAEAPRGKRCREPPQREKANPERRVPEKIGQVLRCRLLKELEERRKMQLDCEYDRVRHLQLKQKADEQLRAEETAKRAILEEKLQKSQGAYELLLEGRNKELKDRAARDSELMTKAKTRAGVREELQRERKELLLQRTNYKIQQARESVVKHIQEKVERVRETNAQKELSHSLLKQRVVEEEEYHRMGVELLIKMKDEKSHQILKEKEAILEESRKIARASFQMRERVRQQINSRSFNQMVLEAQLNASLIK